MRMILSLGATLLLGVALSAQTGRAQTPTRETCRTAIEGRIPWNSQGDTHWNPQNIDKLCAGGAGDQPARCFERLIRGQVNWGGGSNWEWENGVKLCHGSQDSNATIACFEGQIRARIAWESAIANCAVGGSQLQPPLPTQVVMEDQMTVCGNTVQGHIPWNEKGDTHWAQANIERLCKNGVRAEPAECFARLMRGNISWGGGRNWEWENAVNLCHGSREASHTLRCFEDQIRAHVPWERAIPACAAQDGTQRPPPPPPVDQMTVCREAVQGHIPWNSKGDTNWAPTNIEQLCKNGVGDEPAKCFERLMRGHVSWGGGTNWEWANAVDLCHGSQDHRRTISCFEDKIRARIQWKPAIQACRR